ncbi:TonB-dependent receptor [Arcticibacterium luteifluviistationis]|nr:TonB-dependent receptor [Arcticibacterium luteifluviistationis]
MVRNFTFLRASMLVLVVMFMATSVFAQSVVSGTITDGSNNEPLIGASVSVKGTAIGTTSDIDGKYSLNGIPSGNQTLVISFIGFDRQEISYDGSASVINVTLVENLNALEEIVITGVMDIAKDRQTPIAVSTITRSEIALKAGNQEFPEILKATPSVYTTKGGGGYGDSRISVRGFDQSNTAFLLNGQPINGMEDGKMYWSNWQGVMDVADAVQIQRGLGSSKLAISSVGGTVNIVTKTVDAKKGGFAQAMVGNDGYLKTTAYASTGLMDNGFAFAALLGHWQGDGYINNTEGSGQTYFISAGYMPNKHHKLNFIFTGAPQEHYQRNSYTLATLIEKGAKYNGNSVKDDIVPSIGGNYYHKPIANLSWDFTIDSKTSLATVLYGSWGRGGSIGLRNYAGQDGDFYNLNTIRTANGSKAPNAAGDIVGDRSRVDGSRVYDVLRSSANEHQWYGMITNFSKKLSESLSFSVGFDARAYHGEHFRRVVDFLGADGWADGATPASFQGDQYYVTEAYSSGPWAASFHDTPRNQRFGYDNPEDIKYIGGFGQLEYIQGPLSAFAQGAVSSQSHVRYDYFNYPAGQEESEKVVNPGYNVKGGLNYNLDSHNNVFANAGYYSRQPFQDNMFLNFRNDVNPLLTNEGITGLELGYGYRSSQFNANVNLYHTKWADRVLSGGYQLPDNVEGFYSYQGVTQIHSGLELDFRYNPSKMLTFKGAASFGNWKYDGNAVATIYDDSQNIVSEGETLYLDGVKVGDAAQTTFNLGAIARLGKGFRIDADYFYYANLHASINPTDSEFSTPNNRGSVQLPNYGLVDLGVSYTLSLPKDKSLVFRLNSNNLFDTEYIAESYTNIHAESGDAIYDTKQDIQFSTANTAFFGYGRTWNFSVRYKF